MQKIVKMPQQARSRKRVTAILSVAKNLFLEHGYDHVTMAVIARQAGVPVGSIYQFFPSKKALLTTIGQEYIDATEAFHASIAAMPFASLNDYFACLLAAMTDYYQQSGSLDAIFETSNDLDVQAIANEVHAQTMQYMQQVVRQFVDMSQKDMNFYCLLSGTIAKPLLTQALQQPDHREHLVATAQASLAALWQPFVHGS